MGSAPVSPTLRAVLIFAATYVVISGWRIGGLSFLTRPAGALLGAVAMVAFGVMTPGQAYAAVNLDTLVLLLGTMILSNGLAQSGFYGELARRLARSGLGPRGLLTALSLSAGIASAFLVNDTVCLMLAPVAIGMAASTGRSPVPFLMALATSANIGSALTLTGNPQNMVVGSLSGIPYLRFAAVCLAPVALALGANLALLHAYYRRALAPAHPAAEPTPTALDRPLMHRALACIALAVAGFAATEITGLNLAWTALTAAALLLVVSRRDPHRMLGEVDWTLLLFFAGLFVVIGGLGHVGALRSLEERFARPLLGESPERQTIHLTWLTVVGSQIFSNVPFVIVAGDWAPRLAEPELAWCVLAFASTVAGNLTILGSVANVIVLEQARAAATIGFWEHLKFGALTTLASIVLGVGALLAEHALGWI